MYFIIECKFHHIVNTGSPGGICKKRNGGKIVDCRYYKMCMEMGLVFVDGVTNGIVKANAGGQIP